MAENQDKGGFQAPSDYDQNVGRTMGAGWLEKVPGSLITGRLVSRGVMKNQTNDRGEQRVFYQVEIDAKAGVYAADGKTRKGPLRGQARDEEDPTEKTEVEFKPGDLVNIGEHDAIQDLAKYCNNGGLYDLWMVYISKDPHPTDKRKTIWRMAGPKLKTVKAPTVKQNNDIPY